MSSDFSSLQKNIGHNFSDKTLLEAALTHASMQNAAVNNERLEFLGDRVLGLVVAEMLYREFPLEKEGQLAKRHTALVQRAALVGVAEGLSLGGVIRISSGEMKAGGAQKDTILCDAMEALIGAVYLDAGFDAARALVTRFWTPLLRQDLAPPEDAKTLLQEWAQARGLPLPEYKVVSQTGSAHEPVFEIEVSVKATGKACASASSKREAEKEAARRLLEKIGT
jgi:ribonuclease-3